MDLRSGVLARSEFGSFVKSRECPQKDDQNKWSCHITSPALLGFLSVGGKGGRNRKAAQSAKPRIPSPFATETNSNPFFQATTHPDRRGGRSTRVEHDCECGAGCWRVRSAAARSLASDHSCMRAVQASRRWSVVRAHRHTRSCARHMCRARAHMGMTHQFESPTHDRAARTRYSPT